MANKEFLKKVYDKYLDTDYSYGVSNLNPKREINLDVDDTDKVIQNIEDAIRQQFEEIKINVDKTLSYKVPYEEKPYEPPEEIGSLTGMPSNKPENYEDMALMLGGHLPVFPNVDLDNPLSLQIEEYIMRLTPFVVGDEKIDDDKDEKLKGLNIPFFEMMDCENAEEDPFGDDGDTDEEDLDLPGVLSCVNGFKCKTHPEMGGVFATDAERQFAQEHGGYCKLCFEDIDDTDENGKGKNPNGNNDPDDPPEPPDTPERKQREDFPCVLAQLRFLKMILIFIRIIKVIGTTVSVTLSIAIPLCKIVSRCATCWTAPPNAAEAVSLVGEALVALLIDIMGSVIQMIWDMLQLDCLDSMAKDLKRQIQEALASINSLATMGDSIKMMSKELQDAIDEDKKAIAAAKAASAERKAKRAAKKAEQDALKAPLKAKREEIKNLKKNIKELKKNGAASTELGPLESQLSTALIAEASLEKALEDKIEDQKSKPDTFSTGVDQVAKSFNKQMENFGGETVNDLKKVLDDFNILKY